MIRILFFCTLLVASQKVAYNRLAVEDFQAAVQQPPVALIDVRTPEEFEEGHIPGAANIDYLNTENFRASFDCYDRETPIYVYCKLGGRSKKAAQILLDMGFKEVNDLKGGYMTWRWEYD